MREIIITNNDAGRRLDRFLRKYLTGASLGEIYKFIRKDVKVNARRQAESYVLNEGDVLALYLSDEVIDRLSGAAGPARTNSAAPTRRSFGIVYEDDNVLIADKPYGLLTHGDSREKKNHLANQVKDYLIAGGSYDPRNEKVFSPAPVNRLDRNTTGLVLFGKTSAALRELGRIIREDELSKFYLTIACGVIRDELRLCGTLTKDEASNKVSIHEAGGDGRQIETVVRPLEVLSFGGGLRATLCEVELITGRSHQIRAHLSSAGHPLTGDSKYAGRGADRINRYVSKKYGLTTQLLHAYRIEFSASLPEHGGLGYLAGKSFVSHPSKSFSEILKGLGAKNNY